MTLRTLDYGTIPIVKSKEWLKHQVIDTIEGVGGFFYEIKVSFAGILVALELEA